MKFIAEENMIVCPQLYYHIYINELFVHHNIWNMMRDTVSHNYIMRNKLSNITWSIAFYWKSQVFFIFLPSIFPHAEENAGTNFCEFYYACCKVQGYYDKMTDSNN